MLEFQLPLTGDALIDAIMTVPVHYAAPTPTARGTPSGIMLRDGYSTKITFATNPTIEFWEKMVQPIGLDGGEKIPQSTMFNTTLHTYAPRALIDVLDGSTKVAWDPKCYQDVLSLINFATTITFTFPDGSTVAFYGYLKSFVPDQMEEGKQPEATIVVVATNTDKSNSYVEATPVETDVAGT